MSQHPAGVFNPLARFRGGPPAPLYRSGIVAPTRSVAFMVELQADEVSTGESRTPVWQIGVHQGLYRRIRQTTVLTPTVRRFATLPLISGPDEDPPNMPIDGSLLPITVDRAVEITDGRFAGIARAAVGTIELRNADGALDDLDADLAVIGRPVRGKVGTYRLDDDGRTPLVDGSPILDVLATESDDVLVLESGDWLALDSSSSTGVLSGFGTIFSGTIEAVDWGDNRARVTARDPRLLLERPIQRNTYSGSGGLGGTEQQIGITKPKAYGFCRQIVPTLIDPGRLIYQYHDGEARGVEVLRIGGLEIPRASILVASFSELAALEQPGVDSDGDIPLGTFVDCPMAGCFRLANIAAGTITCDVRGAGFANSLREAFSDGTLFTDGTGWRSAARAVHSRTATQVMLRLFDEVADFGRDEVAVDQLIQLGAELPYEVGVYLEAGGQESLDNVLALLADSMGALLFRAKDGRYQIRRYAEPNEVPVLTIRRDMILPTTLQRVSLPYRQPWSDWNIAFARNHHPMGDNEFVEAVTAEDRQRMTREQLVARVVNRTAAALYSDRAPIEIRTALSGSGDAVEVGNRLSRFLGPGRVMFELRVKGIAYRLDLLDTVRIVHPRYGLAQGRNMVVLAVSEDGGRLDTWLRVFG